MTPNANRVGSGVVAAVLDVPRSVALRARARSEAHSDPLSGGTDLRHAGNLPRSSAPLAPMAPGLLLLIGHTL